MTIHSAQQEHEFRNVALIATPWPLFSHPSIQLGTLKAYLQSRFPALRIDARHIYLQVAEAIGYKLYQALSERVWLAESVYAALLFPERADRIEKLFLREAAGSSLLLQPDFQALVSRVGQISERCIDSLAQHSCHLAGFSICLCQMTSSLYFIRALKQRLPGLKVVVGGSTFAGEGIPKLLTAFPEVDYVVNGEGELPLAGLIEHLRNTATAAQPLSIPGVTDRWGARQGAAVTRCQMEDLSALPVPDYDDFFALLKSFGPAKNFFPTLSVEISRGCWWCRPRPGREPAGCAFCNLNLQWQGYRTKNPAQIAAAVDALTSRYQALSVAFVDNAIPLRDCRAIFHQLAEQKKDLHLFGEIRAVTPKQTLQVMRAAGLAEVQIGIEALSSSLLQKMAKGTTAIQNLAIMKHCEELGIDNGSNLILHFPGSDESDVQETLRTLDFALPFRPLRLVRFWLGYGSPVWQSPWAYGIKAVMTHPNYGILFPAELVKSMVFMIQAYRGDLGRQRKMWQPVQTTVKAWQAAYAALHCGPSRGPALSFRDGRDFLIIRQRRPGAETLTHRLAGTSREIYLYCQECRTLKDLANRFPKFGEDRITPFLRMLVDKKLMFTEGDQVLSLAVPRRSR